jgi:hypothetical protein
MAEAARHNTAERRDRFRAFMARLDGAGDPRSAIERGLYVDQPAAVADSIATRLELRPATTQLIVGGVGTGKTTQLLVARERLVEKLPDAIAIYLDVSAHQVLDQMKPGSVLALAALEIAQVLAETDERVESYAASFKKWAHGEWIEPDDDDVVRHPEETTWPPSKVFSPGVVTSPESLLESEIWSRLRHLGELLSFKPEGAEVAVFIDSLDRLTDVSMFQTAIEQDIAALSSVGIGVVVVGPLRAIYGLERVVADRFDNIHRQSPIDAAPDSDGLTFLIDVLRRRADPDMLPDEACRNLACASGGVLRDLVRLAHQAGEEAYLAGAACVEDVHIQRAADGFGRSLMMGLSSEDIDKLRKIEKHGQFVETSERDLALLATRRILDYHDGVRTRTAYIRLSRRYSRSSNADHVSTEQYAGICAHRESGRARASHLRAAGTQ